MGKTIPRRTYQRWDGGLIYRTKDCDSCDFYREINNQNLCGWGVAFKYLVEKEKPKKCEIRNRPIQKPWIEEFKEHNCGNEAISMLEIKEIN